MGIYACKQADGVLAVGPEGDPRGLEIKLFNITMMMMMMMMMIMMRRVRFWK